MKFTAIIVFLIPVVVARHNHRTVLESILKSTDNQYAKMHNDVQNAVNNLFDVLNLPSNFTEKSRIKLFLRMHYDLNNMAAKNYDEHIQMKDAARPDTDNSSSKGLALFKLIEKTLNEEPLNLLSAKLDEKTTTSGVTIPENTIVQRAATKPTVTPTSVENINKSDPIFADSKEFKQFIKDFIKKVNKLNETDLANSTPLLPPIEEYVETTTQPDIEYWQPPPFDNFNDTNTRRIFKGRRSGVKTFPFIVSIHFMDLFVCAGSILSSDLVITAASCLQILHNNRFFRENPRAVEVRIGSDYFIRGGEKIPVLETFFYPSYNPKTLANNLVLLRLNRHIKFYKISKKVKKIRYDRGKDNLPANTNGITVAGWGSAKHSNIIEQFERLMSAKLDIYHVDECAKIYTKQYVTYRHFCAGFISRGGGACNKDLGGPGILGGVLVGVISFGAPMCGAMDAPTVFTKIGYYAKWIDSIIGEHGRSLAVRTTLKYLTDRNYYYDPTPPPRENPYITYETTRGTITPIIVVPENTLEEEEVEEESRTDLRRGWTYKIQQLFPFTPTTRQPMLPPIPLMRGLLYEDYGTVEDEDVSDMFKTTTKLIDPIQHPLANLSLLPVNVFYTVKPVAPKTTKRYTMMTLTTSPGPRLHGADEHTVSTLKESSSTHKVDTTPNLKLWELATEPPFDVLQTTFNWLDTSPESPETTTESSSPEPTTEAQTTSSNAPTEKVEVEYYYDLLRV